MKARVKATGEIIEVIENDFVASNGMIYDEEDLIIFKDEPSYYNKLLYQAAIAAMQGLLSNSAYIENFVKYSVEGDSLARVVSTNAIDYATTLVNKLKKEEK